MEEQKEMNEKERPKHFMAVLGTSLYQNCIYEIEEENFQFETEFVQLAVLEYVMKEMRPQDRITIFLTESAEKENWNTRKYTAKDVNTKARNGVTVTEKDDKIGLKDLLEQRYPEKQIESVSIPEGNSTAELKEIFERMYAAIKENEEVYFDFTHGLRNIPIQALTIINYAKVSKNITVGGLYYGPFEIGDTYKTEDGREIKHVKLFDMMECNSILEWTGAAQSFLASGSSKQIKNLYDSHVGKKQEEKKILKTVEALYDFTSCLETSRGKCDNSGEKSIRKAYENFEKRYKEMKEEGKESSEVVLTRLFDKIELDVKVFRRKIYYQRGQNKICLEDTSIGLAAIDWAIRKDLTQQGFTALEETIKTYACELYDLPHGEELYRDVMAGGALKAIADKIFRTREIQEKEFGKKIALEEVEIKREEIWEIRCPKIEKHIKFIKIKEEEKKEEYLKKTKCLIENVSSDLAILSRKVAESRNAINHFGFNTERSYKKLQQNLREFYKEFYDIIKCECTIKM